MRVGILSYPMLFQNDGGLQVQIRETISQLRLLGVDVRLIEVTNEKLADYDIIHVFAITQGNYKLVEQARAKGCKVVVSSLLNRALVPPDVFSLRAVQLLEKAIARLSGYTVATTYGTDRKALMGADHVVALSQWEHNALINIYGVPPRKISVIPNAVSNQFYDADPEPYLKKYPVEGQFVLCPAQISSWKNQKTLVEALAGTHVAVVLAGHVAEHEKEYLNACLMVPGAKVKYLGNLDRASPEFIGSYAAASAVVLPSRSESGPLVALEALAAGTPAIITKNNGLDIMKDGRCFTVVDPFDVKQLRTTVLQVLASKPDAAQCRQVVLDFSWYKVAEKIKNVYDEQMQNHGRCLTHS